MPRIVPFESITLLKFDGLVTNRSPLAAPTPGTLWDGENVEVDELGLIRRRLGFSKFSTAQLAAGEKPQRFYSFRQLDGTLLNIADVLGRFSKFTSSAITTIFTSGGNAPFSFQHVGSMLYAANVTDAVKWDGTTQTLWGIVAPTTAPDFELFGGVYVPTAASGTNWTDPTNVFENDDILATYNAATQDILAVTGFSIVAPPDAAGVEGITVVLEGNGSSVTNAQRDIQIALTKDGSTAATPWQGYTQGTKGGQLLVATDTTTATLRMVQDVDTAFTLGGSADIWKTTWAVADLTASTFGVLVKDADTTAALLRVDSVTVRPYWSTAASPIYAPTAASGTNWTTPTNVYADDAAYAIYNNTARDILKITGYGVTVPAGRTVTGFLVTINGNGTSATTAQRRIQVALTKDGSTAATTWRTVTLDQTTDNDYQKGSRSDLWGTTWTEAEVEASTFGVLIRDVDSTAAALNIDYVPVRIFYDGIYKGVTGLSPTAGYVYRYCFKNSGTGHVSTASTKSDSTSIQTGIVIQVSGDRSADAQVDKVEIYRTADGGGKFFKLVTLANPGSGRWSYNDALPDNQLGIDKAPLANLNNPPPSGLANITYHLGRMWGSVDNFVYYSGGGEITNGVPEEAWSPLNYFILPGKVTALVPYSIGLLVFLESDIWVIAGTGRLSFYAVPWLIGMGVKDSRAVVSEKSLLIFFTSRRELMALTEGGLMEIGVPIGDKLLAYDPASVNLAIHKTAEDGASLYITNGSTEFYKFSIDRLQWSPKATVTGGIQAVGSVETASGTYDLLAGRTALNGYILKRGTNQDDGTSFTAFATLGSFVVAPPGSLAEINNVVVERNNAGTAPTCAVLPQEVSGSFTTLSTAVDAPPELAASTTAPGHLWYLEQAAIPTVMRHLQVKITFPTENAANKLYSLSIQGAVQRATA